MVFCLWIFGVFQLLSIISRLRQLGRRRFSGQIQSRPVILEYVESTRAPWKTLIISTIINFPFEHEFLPIIGHQKREKSSLKIVDLLLESYNLINIRISTPLFNIRKILIVDN